MCLNGFGGKEMKIDVFAHVWLPEFKKRMLMLDDDLLTKYPFARHPDLDNLALRREHAQSDVRQIVSYTNTNPEDYMAGKMAALLVRKANEGLLETVKANDDLFYGAVAMLALNNIDESLNILEDTVLAHKEMLGVQLFTRHLSKSVADEAFRPIISTCAKLGIPIWLHPVFDERKPDNNIVFSWEYEQSQAMLQLVQAGYFQEFPDLTIIVHHAGAMAPYFAGRIEHILPKELAADFKKFYVDTALLGNSKALELAIDYFGVEHVLFGTDAPLGTAPAGATKEIIAAIEQLPLSSQDKEAIFTTNIERLVRRKGC